MPDIPRAAQLEAVIFDMDGVVTRTARLHARAWKQLFDEYLDRRRARGETHEPFDVIVDDLGELSADELLMPRAREARPQGGAR